MPTVAPSADGLAKRLFFRLVISSGILLFFASLGVQAGWSSWLGHLGWIAVVPLGVAARVRVTHRWRCIVGWLGGIAFFLPATYWVWYTHPSAWLGWVLLASYLACYFPLFLYLLRTLTLWWRLPTSLALPIAWVATEYLRLHLLTGFSLLLLAHGLARSSITIQSADLGGVYLVSFIMAVVSGVVVDFLTEPLVDTRTQPVRLSRFHRWNATFAFSLLFLHFTYGIFRVVTAPSVSGPPVVLVQSDIAQSIKQDNHNEAWGQIVDLLRPLHGAGVALVVLPETCYPYQLGTIDPQVSDIQVETIRLRRLRGQKEVESVSRELLEKNGAITRENLANGMDEVTNLARFLDSPVLLGAIVTNYAPGRLDLLNSALLLDPRKGLIDAYDKVHLVPFGEYLPLRESLPLLRRLMPYDEGVEFGIDHAPLPRFLTLGKFHFGVAICYEDTLPHLVRRIVRLPRDGGPSGDLDFLVNQSNDGWFRGSIGSDYHFAAAVFRTVECRIPLVRAANMGITALVDGSGRIQAELPKSTQDRLNAEVPLDGRWSLYLEIGDTFAIGCLIVAVGGWIASWIDFFRRLFVRLVERSGQRPGTSA